MKKFCIRIGLLILMMGLAIAVCCWLRGHAELRTRTVEFTESTKELNNPERGFYHIYGFRINEYGDYEQQVKEKIDNDEDIRLCMVQINLQDYSNGDISETGLKHIEELFCALEKIDKKYIVRFLYDWNGENMLYEPKSIDIILRHMEQIGPIIDKYQHKIYTMQGVFTGNCGEMNTTRYSSQEDLNILIEQLISHTKDTIYLSVRTPSQWRMSLEAEELTDLEAVDGLRVGLFNDAIMGNEGDYGTYWTGGSCQGKLYGMRDRASELEFQSELCRYVPNGGEVIVENHLNDFENAKDTLRKMRISYLNIDYDKNVLEKWAESKVVDQGIYNGMNGLDYIERHMGYRFLIDEAKMDYDIIKDELSIDITLKNVGFAPIYHDKKLILTVCDKEGNIVHCSEYEQDIRTLYGGTDMNDELELIQRISVFGWDSEKYEIYFRIQDEKSKEIIQLANEQTLETYGYKIGTVTGGMKGWYLGEIFSQLQ